MAPEGDSAYFPPLDICLSGDFQLLSWRTTFTGLSQLSSRTKHERLKRHLTDKATFDILVQCLSPYPAATPQSRAAFETRTSAIHVTPTAEGPYDIQQIKDDTLWLSKEIGIDELSALRLAILEWQTRAAAHLSLASLDLDPSVISPDRSLHTTHVELRSVNGVGSQIMLRADPELVESSAGRHLRLLDFYLSERRYLLKTVEFILFLATYRADTRGTVDSSLGGLEGDDAEHNWVEHIGIALLKVWDVSCAKASSSKNWFHDVTLALQNRVDALDKGSGFLKEESVKEEFEIAWNRNQILEMVHIMQIILVSIHSFQELTKPSVILSWFKFAGQFGFFEQAELLFHGEDSVYLLPFQANIALVSLAILNIPIAIEKLEEISTLSISAADATRGSHYLLQEDCILQVTEILVDAAKKGSCNASPAVFAWGIILQTLREYASKSKEVRELRQSQRAANAYGPTLSEPEGREGLSGTSFPSPNRRSSGGSDASQQPTYLEEIQETLDRMPLNEDPIALLARCAVDYSHVFDIITNLATDFCTQYGSEHQGKCGLQIRLLLLDLIRAAAQYIEYGPEIVSATLAILTGSGRYWEILASPQHSRDAQPAAVFLNDSFLMERLFDAALSRFPYEVLPFLKLCRALASSSCTLDEGKIAIKSILENIPSFTSTLDDDGYTNRLDVDNSPYLELNDSVEIFPHRRVHGLNTARKRITQTSGSAKSPASNSDFQLPAQTAGRVLSNGKPLVVIWHYEYSGFKYMGRFLQQAMDNKDMHYSDTAAATTPVVIEIIGMLTAILASASNDETTGQIASEVAQEVLEEASDGLDRNQDVVSIILAIFEDELYRIQSTTSVATSTELLIHCIEFSHALLLVLPSRIWPFLARSGLISLDGKESRLSAVISGFEMPSGRYGFLHGCIRVFDALIDDVIKHAVSRKISTKALARFGEQDTVGAGISDSVIKKVLRSMGQITVDVFETSRSWRFADPEECAEISSVVCSVLDKILTSCFKVDDNPDLAGKLTGLLAPTATYLLEAFFSKANNDLPALPLLHIFLEGMTIPESSLPTRLTAHRISQIIAALKLSNTLVRLNQHSDFTPAHLEETLFKSIPVLVKLYSIHDNYRLPIIELLEILVNSIGRQEAQPPSMLGCLGQDIAKYFLEMISTLDQPLNDKLLSIAIWKFLAAVVSQRQQWFSIYLLRGSTPREALRDNDKGSKAKSQNTRSMLNVASRRLSHLERLQPEEAGSILEFLTLAADFWPWVLTQLDKDHELLAILMDQLPQADASATNDTLIAFLKTPHQILITSYIISLFGLYIHSWKEKGDVMFAKKLVPRLGYLIQHAVDVPSYNASLHGNLRKNFGLKFPGCNLGNFKKTPFSPSKLGDNYYYDLEIAGLMLDFDPAWARKGKQSFAEEFSRANINMSIVESQINLLNSWKSLVVELSLALGDDGGFHKSLATVIQRCLVSNMENTLPDAIFVSLARSRVDLAFILTQRILEIAPSSVEARNILKPAWETLRNHAPSLGAALIGPEADYVRLLLRIVYTALQAHTRSPSESENQDLGASRMPDRSETTQIVLEIIRIVVAQGFRSLTATLHDDASRVLPVDFALIIAILRTALCVPGIGQLTTHLVSQFTDDNTARYASTLLSWSDQLTVGNDPVYGELSIMYLVELSTVPALAESIAVEGILTQVSSANLMNYFRRDGGIGPLAEPVRMHRIWSRGLLPLALNLLRAIGAPIAAEVAAFLNQFQNQMQRAATDVDMNPITGCMTLDLSLEIQSLALLTVILDTIREAGASAGILSSTIAPMEWGQAQAKEDLYSLLQRRKALRERIVPTNEREEAWARQRPLKSESAAENRLEEKIVDELGAALAFLGGNDN